MHRNGHYGASLLGYAPIGAVVLTLGFRTAAIGGAVVAVGLAMLPDYDQRVPGIKHRGPTHTVHFAGVVAVGTAALGAFVAYLHPDLGTADAVGLAVFGAVVGGVTILSHIAADALTPMGVEPFGDDRHYSFEVCRADSTLWNYGLLLLGLAGSFLAYVVGQAANPLLPV
jgi:inner membrane protein